ncbi:MAG: hypothetical protein JOZ69_10070 [Myxococcales bacterium]|nr:hypothetical protein [Myxococcales bacterium]
MPDIDATTGHLRVANPDVFFTKSPIQTKGTGCHKTVERWVLARAGRVGGLVTQHEREAGGRRGLTPPRV